MGVAYACVGQGVYGKSLSPSSQFCYESKTSLKKNKRKKESLFLKKNTQSTLKDTKLSQFCNSHYDLQNENDSWLADKNGK